MNITEEISESSSVLSCLVFTPGLQLVGAGREMPCYKGEIPPMIITAGINTRTGGWAGPHTGNSA